MATKDEDKKDEIKLPDTPTEDLPPEGYSDEDWADLSPAERAGIKDSLENPEVSEITEKEEIPDDVLKKIAGEDGAEKKTADAEVPPSKPGEEKKAGEQSPPAESITDDQLLSFVPVITADEIQVEEEIPEEIQGKLMELDEKYDAGELNISEYNAGRDKLNRQIFKHNITLEEKAKSEVVWKKEQMFFLNSKPEYIRADGDSDEVKANKTFLYNNLSAMVETLSNDPKNANLTGMQLLIRADKAISKIKETLGFKKTGGSSEKAPADKKPPATIPDVKTLSNVPPAGSNNTLDDSFAQLDKLTGEAYEEALERLRPEVKAAYLDRV